LHYTQKFNKIETRNDRKNKNTSLCTKKKKSPRATQ